MSLRQAAAAALFGLSSALVAACSSSTSTPSGAPTEADAGAVASEAPRPTTTLFARSVTRVAVEIDYAAGAEPYVGSLKDFGDPWRLFNGNALAIFDGKKTLTFPKTLAAMEKLTDVSARSFSRQDILAIAAAHRTDPPYANVGSFYVVFLPGTWIDDAGTEQKQTLSVSLGDTGVIAMFKPAIATPVVNPTPAPQLVEQLALLHAFGHAVGFVDDGVPVGEANRAHVDPANPHHCANTQCALTFAVEGAGGAAAFAKQYVRSPEAVLIGQECLSDARLLESAQLGL
jgi:hypothetical protein